MKSKNKVEFFRYYRPVDKTTGYARSDMGVCFYIKMNYKEGKRWMRVSASVCNGDNFEKWTAKENAKWRYDLKDYAEFELDDFQFSGASIVDFLKDQILYDDNFCGVWQAVRKQLKMEGV